MIWCFLREFFAKNCLNGYMYVFRNLIFLLTESGNPYSKKCDTMLENSDRDNRERTGSIKQFYNQKNSQCQNFTKCTRVFVICCLTLIFFSFKQNDK
jgi:hypothetical protein